MPKLRVINSRGDEVMEYTEEDTDAVRKEFNRLLKNGNVAYRIDGPGRGTHIRSFDPRAEEIVVRGPLVGG